MAILRSKEIWEMEIERTQKDYCSCSYNYEPKTEGELNVKNL